MASRLATALLCWVATSAVPQSSNSSSAATEAGRGSSIVHVTVIDVVTGTELKDQTVTIKGDRIVSVAPWKDEDGVRPGAIDSGGAFLIPGLWDMHVHVHDVHELPLYVANGVTGIRIMSGERDTARLRGELSGESPSPQIYLASAIVDGSPPTWPESIVVKKPDDARRAVDEIKAGGADFIKVYSGIPHDAYLALADEAKRQQISFAGHVPDAVTAQEASAAGQRSMEHLLGMAAACSKEQERLTAAAQRVQFFRERLQIEADGYRSFDAAKCRALFEEFKANQTWQVPTLTVRRVWGMLDEAKFTSDPRLAYIRRASRRRWEERTGPQQRIWNSAMYQEARAIFATEQKLVGMMYRAGVPLLAGTDAMNPYCFPGFGLHDELGLLVASGLTPLAALQAATIRPAQFMGRTADTGSIEPGKMADMILLDADPVQDIHNTTKIRAVWRAGRYFDRAYLDLMLDQAKRDARN